MRIPTTDDIVMTSDAYNIILNKKRINEQVFRRKTARWNLRRKTMGAREILEQSISDHNEAIEKAKRELASLETTYSVGDRFKHCDDVTVKFLMVYAGGKVGIVAFGDGIEYGAGFVRVGNICHITQKEFMSMGPSFDRYLIRYWDNKREIKT